MQKIIRFFKSQSVEDWIQMGLWAVAAIILCTTYNFILALIFVIAGAGFGE